MSNHYHCLNCHAKWQPDTKIFDWQRCSACGWSTCDPVTHNTFVIGFNNGRITFIKSYDYITQKEEAQKDLAFVQNSNIFSGWLLSHAGNWILEHKNEGTERYPVNIPMP